MHIDQAARYVVKFNNGTYKIFDRVNFEDVDTYDSLKAANEALARLNSGASKRQERKHG